MANYNTFLVVECKRQKTLLVTSSARLASKYLEKGVRVDVWNDNRLVETIYSSRKPLLGRYIEEERRYIQKKQLKAEHRNMKYSNKKEEKYREVT